MQPTRPWLRSRAVSGSSKTEYRYDNIGSGPATWSVLNEEYGSGTLQATFIHSSSGGSATPGRQEGTVLATSEGRTTTAKNTTPTSDKSWRWPCHQDAIGSTRGLWDENGDRLGKYEYAPFGWSKIRRRRRNTPTTERTSPGSSRATTGTARRGCIIRRTDTTARMRTAGSRGIRWAWSMGRMCMRMW